MPIFQSAMREFDDLDRRQRELDRAQNVGERQMLVVEVAPDDEGDLRLDLGLDQLVAGHVPSVRDRHVVEQHAVVGLIDADLALHLNVRLRRFAIITAVKHEIRGHPSLKYAA